MLHRYNLWPLVRANFVSTSASTSWRERLATIGMSFILPVLVGAAVGWLVQAGIQVGNGIAVALPAVSLLVGAMFGAFVFLTNLRVKLAESSTYAFRASLQKLVGSSAAGCLYVAVTALAAAGLLAAVGSVPLLRDPSVKPMVVGVIVAVLAHVGISLLVVVRRLFVVYYDMFAADFNKDVPVGPQRVFSARSERIGSRR